MKTSNKELLQRAGLRATQGRLALLAHLEKEPKPVSVEVLAKALPSFDTVTLYRSLEALYAAGLVERSELGHGHAHYELAIDRPHHHHAVCRTCGRVEDIEIPHAPEPARVATEQARGFAFIDRYTLEFFGLCTKCA